MTERIKRTLDLKNEILSFYSTSEDDKKIVDTLCFATNTLPVVESAFNICSNENINIEHFYKKVLYGFIQKNEFPLCCESIIEFYPSLYDYALETALPRVEKDIYISKTDPCIDAGVIHIPLDSKWGDFINLSFINCSEHNKFVVAQLLSKLEQINYELKGDCTLVTGSQKRTMHAGLYTFFYGRNWLVREGYKK